MKAIYNKPTANITYSMKSWKYFLKDQEGIRQDSPLLPYLFNIVLKILSSVQFSSSVVSDYLWPYGLQHTRPPCYCWVSSVVSDSVWPHRWQPTRLPCPWDSPGKNTGVGHHFLLQCMKVKSESEVTQLCPTLSDSMDCSHQAPPSMGFSR